MLGVVYMSDVQQVDPSAFPATVAVTAIFAISNPLRVGSSPCPQILD